ncbi:ankyrin-1-like [Saccostrea cucullata]|uniref:ankyrin-1-like n=2 Tax=Saccostrea cuccullata TaxID=36930 RepID=UPI002ED19E65
MKEFFLSNQVVVVVGPPGSGKTALIRHIALQLESEYQIVPISKPEEIINYGDLNRPQIFVIDDVLGVFTLERNLLSDLERHSKQIEDVLNRKSKFLMSCRLAVYNEAKVLDVVFLEIDKILNLNEKNVLTSEDQKGIFESHMNNARISCEIDLKLLHRKDVFMFPLLCQMFSSDENVRKYGKQFFTRPSECWQSEINKIQKRNKIQYLSIVLCMLNNNCLSEEMLSKSKMFQEVCRACKVKENTENWEIFKELSHLIDTYITKDDEKYTFIHDSIFEVVAYQYGQQFPDQILDYMNSNFIANKVVLDTKENTCNDAKCIRLNKFQYEKLAKRLYADVKAGKLHDVFLNKALRDCVFKQKFMDILKGVPCKDVKREFLLPRKESFDNVVFDSQKESEKQIDETKGQRESERQNLLLGLKCIDQKKIYEIRALSFIIYYGHLDLLNYFIKLVKKCQTLDIIFGTTPEEHVRLLVLACFNGNLDMVKIMVEYIGKENINSMPVGDIKPSHNKHRYITPVIAACLREKYDVVKYLVDNGADLNPQKSYYPALWTPARTGDLRKVMELLKFGADCNKCSGREISPLYMASRFGHLEVVKKLIEHGADINKCDIKGWSSLHIASLYGHSFVLETLIHKGAECDRCDKNKVTPLHRASLEGHVPVVEILLKNGADSNKCEIHGSSSLHLASLNGHLSVVETLLLHGAECDRCDEENLTPLHFASFRGFVLVVEKLVEHGADVNKCNNNGRSSLHLASQNGQLSVVEKLISHGAKCGQCDINKSTPLHFASEEGHLPVVEKLIEHCADVKVCNIHGQSSLHLASKRGHLHVVKTLIRHGAKCDQYDINKSTPLHFASEEGHLHVVEKLIAHCADVKVCNIHGQSPLHLASKRGQLHVVETLIRHGAECDQCDNNNLTPLHKACFGGHSLVVEKIIESGVDINKSDNKGSSPLLLAIWEGHLPVVEKLIELGADINTCYINRWTPLLLASWEGHDLIVEKLLGSDADVNKCNNYGWSPLLLSSWKGHLSVVDILIMHGADINNVYINGWSPLSLASWEGHLSVVEKLIEQGADINKCDVNSKSSKNSKNNQTAVVETNIKEPSMSHAPIVEIMSESGTDINQCDYNGSSPLLLAIWKGHLSVVEKLVEQGANINRCYKNGWSPLLLSSWKGQFQVVEKLLMHGADSNNCYINGWSPLSLASWEGHLSVVEKLIE